MLGPKSFWPLLAAAMCGCVPHRPVPATQATTRPAERQITLSLQSSGPLDPRDPQPPWQAVIQLDIYQIDLPLGTISDNEPFWKRVDEHCVSVATAYLLNKNGLRCGLASRSDWDYFRQQLKAPEDRVKHTSIMGLWAHDVELNMTKKFDVEDIFFFNSQDQIEGRTWRSCENRVDLSFDPDPRTPYTLRVALCPTVQSQQTLTDFTAINRPLESTHAAPQHIYDLGLCAEIDQTNFLIVAPNSSARSSLSVGGRFFITDDQTQRFEQVLAIVPTFLRPDGKPVVLREALAGH